MDHPAIVNVMRTGHPDGRLPETLECVQCGEEISKWHYRYDTEEYCSPMCIAIKLLEDGEIEKIA